jgi:hypothetical protein
MENSNLLGDVDYSIANYERKRAQKAQILRQQIARQTSAPGFVLLVRHFAEQLMPEPIVRWIFSSVIFLSVQACVMPCSEVASIRN